VRLRAPREHDREHRRRRASGDPGLPLHDQHERDNANLACGSEIAGTLVDKIAFGTANCAEGTAVAALSVTTGAARNGDGLDDTDSNVADFTIVTAPVPRNAASPANPNCGGGGGPPPCPADLNGDRDVGPQDLAVLLGNWGNPGVGDINGDGVVGAQDLAAMLGVWGLCP